MSLGRNCRMVLVEQNIFTTNSASSGGAVYYRESTLQTVPNNLSTDVLITDNVFISNSASSCGSAIVGANSRFSTQTSLQPTYRLTLDSNVFSTSGEVAVLLVLWSAGLLSCWSAGLLVCCPVGLLSCWCAVLLVCWSGGLLVYCLAGLLSC